MRIAILGVGGVGGYFGARLAAAGHDVHFIARGAHLAAIRAGGLRVESPLGDLHIDPAQATADPATIGPVDLVLVGVKTWQLAAALEAARPLLGPATAVVPLLNGVEAPAMIADILGPQHALGGLCRIIAFLVGPGHIRHTGIEPAIVFGELDGRATPRSAAIHAALSAAGIQSEIAPDIIRALWEKFMLICTWSGLGAITRAPVGVWRGLPGTRALAEQALREVVAVAQAHGVALADTQVAATLRFLDGVPPGGTASMQRDIVEGRPSELEAQSGALVRLGAIASVPTPVNSFIYHCLLPQEQAARGGSYQN
jgi:2-dehydropantoate 2-reductase